MPIPILGPEKSIYRNEKGLDDVFKIKIDPPELTFVKLLNASPASSIFQVTYCGKPRALKVVRATLTCMS